MARSIGDKVTMSAARGGWRGYITAQQGGDAGLYVIAPEDQTDPYNATTFVADADIEPGSLAKPVYAIGQQITLYGRGGVITAINGSDHTVRIEIPREHYTIVRTHTVPHWRIAIENGG